LCGERGASAVFGPQKGATPEMVAELDNCLRRFAEVVKRDCGADIANEAGAGAAGGMGGGLLVLPRVQLKAGVQIVIDYVGLEAAVCDADWVITGEGRMDAQSVRGKTPVGVARVAKRYGKPVIALAGGLREDYTEVYAHGIDAVFPIVRQLGSLEDVLAEAEANLVSAGHNLARMIALKG
ncbi:MAG: glycerate kinase, partial [Neisseria sp.]|nr:glycerate kinase [Neisseria sp.]